MLVSEIILNSKYTICWHHFATSSQKWQDSSYSWFAVQDIMIPPRPLNDSHHFAERNSFWKMQTWFWSAPCISSKAHSYGILELTTFIQQQEPHTEQNIIQLIGMMSLPIAVRVNDPLSPACATFLAEHCNPITRQAIELESCSNPLRIQQVLSKSKKIFFGFGGGFWRWRHKEGMFWKCWPG